MVFQDVKHIYSSTPALHLLTGKSKIFATDFANSHEFLNQFATPRHALSGRAAVRAKRFAAEMLLYAPWLPSHLMAARQRAGVSQGACLGVEGRWGTLWSEAASGMGRWWEKGERGAVRGW